MSQPLLLSSTTHIFNRETPYGSYPGVLCAIQHKFSKSLSLLSICVRLARSWIADVASLQTSLRTTRTTRLDGRQEVGRPVSEFTRLKIHEVPFHSGHFDIYNTADQKRATKNSRLRRQDLD